MDDARKASIVCKPFGLRTTFKAHDAAEGRVLRQTGLISNGQRLAETKNPPGSRLKYALYVSVTNTAGVILAYLQIPSAKPRSRRCRSR
jgi:hypothetical protein